MSAFTDKSRAPEPHAVARTLGRAAPLWSELKERVAARFTPLSEEWVCGGAKHGWSLRLKRQKRAVLYMTPCEGYFRAALVLGEKACAAARNAGLPAGILELIESAPKYPEGRAVRVEVRTARALAIVVRVAEIKMSS